MKKSLIALAALAAMTAASAQSTVTLSGNIGAAFQQHISSATANWIIPGVTAASTSTGVAASNGTAVKGQTKGFALTDRDFTLAVVEDLGGGLSAFGSSKLESNDDFRGSYVQFADFNLGLRSAALGEFKFSNTRTGETYAAIVSPAINLRDGLYDDNGINSARTDIDSVTYTSPELIKGLKASVAYVELLNGDINLAATNRSVYVLGASYVTGPLTVMGAYKTKFKNAVASSTQISKANVELAALYNAGFAVFGLGYDGASTEGSTAIATNGTKVQTDKASTAFSVTVPVGAISLGMEYWKRAASTETRFGASYALSKRTSLTAAYGTKDFPKLSLPASVTADSQYRIGVKHSF